MTPNFFRPALALFLAAGVSSIAQTATTRAPVPDTDHDGLSDALEQSLLEQFAPHFLIAREDCSTRPAEFQPDVLAPSVLREDGTIYGQVFPISPTAENPSPLAELHFYHLWRKDCGGHGHPLDTEHVAVLVRALPSEPGTPPAWQAVYWYAAAHENTVCDVSHLTRASTLHAEDHGATVWVSPGKHASYLNSTLCARGCGADHCERMLPLATTRIINLGEPNAPMNGSVFTASTAWPLAAKMSASNFPAESLARLNHLPATDIAWFNPGRHPAQGIIAHSSSTEEALARSTHNTSTAISVAGDNTTDALGTASDSTGNALSHAWHNTTHALGSSARHVGRAVRPSADKQVPQPH